MGSIALRVSESDHDADDCLFEGPKKGLIERAVGLVVLQPLERSEDRVGLRRSRGAEFAGVASCQHLDDLVGVLHALPAQRAVEVMQHDAVAVQQSRTPFPFAIEARRGPQSGLLTSVAEQ